MLESFASCHHIFCYGLSQDSFDVVQGHVELICLIIIEQFHTLNLLSSDFYFAI